MASDRIYLDNAATSWPKPDAVYEAVMHAMRVLGAPAGRSSYREASEVERLVLDSRRRLARMLGVDDPRRILFTCNGTDSLNMALHGLLRRGDHVVTSVLEHNSVLRPLRYLEQASDLQVTHVGCDQQGIVDPDEIRRAIRPATKLIVLLHVSNVTGAIQPVAEVGRIATEHGLEFLLDAAQSVGHLPFDLPQVGCTMLAAPAHKGLLGPLGLGLLYLAPGREESLSPLRQGGTGTHSESDSQPLTLPDKFESGNHNVPAIAGLRAGLEFIESRGLENIFASEHALTAQLLAGLKEIAGVRIYGPVLADQRSSVVSLTIDGYDPREVASMLDAAYRIQVRSGYHCAPRMHQQLATADFGGTVRFSLGPFNTTEQMDFTVQAVAEIASSAS